MDKTDKESEASDAPDLSTSKMSIKEPNGNADPKIENGNLSEPPLAVNDDEISNIPIESCSCVCGCQKRLEKLENEMNDLKSWKVGKQHFDDIIENWKEEIEKWMQSTFGFSIPGSLSPLKSNENESEVGKLGTENVLEGKSLPVEGMKEDESMNVILNEEETEDVEITPDLFGHFLLDNEYDYGESDADDIEEIDESLDDEEEPEVPEENFRKRSKRRRQNDSDSECYTLSSSSSEDVTSSEDEYEPQRKKGKGRGRGRPQNNTVLQNKPLGQSTNSTFQLTNNSVGELGSTENRAELLKYCRKRQGNIWECTVCGFMLTSFENMLLHIKYNHSSSTHTCPYCRIVVLCRSPQDAIVHQSQCKMRPPFNTNSKPPDPKIIPPSPVQKVAATISTKKPISQKDVHAEVDKFVDDILGFGTGPSTKPTSLPKNNIKKTDSPAVVTLSSDSETSDED